MSIATGKVVAHMSTDALDDVPMGIIRVNTRIEIQYINRAGRCILGPDVRVGMKLQDLSMDAESRRRIDVALQHRRRGEGSAYQVNLLEPRWGTQKLVEITGVPEYDDAGAFIGSLAFLRNLSFESANQNIHRAIEESGTWHVLLERVAAELHKVIHYESFLVTLVSEKRGHLRSLFEAPPFLQASPIRWWPMPPFVRAMLADIDRTTQIDVDEMFASGDFREMLRRDPSTRSWKERGFKHLLRRPVLHKGRQVAVVLLQRTADEPFTDDEVRTFDELPVAEAIDIAISLDRKGEMQFRLDLIRDLGKVANDADRLRAVLVEQLRANYSWEHVSLFRVDEDRKRLVMVCQSALRGRELPEDDWQPIDAGLLGEARKSKRAVIVGNVKEVGSRYLKGVPGTMSEMCLPIPGSRQRWFLNVESSLIDAFAEEEQQSVEHILNVVGFLLDRVESIETKSAIFESVADGVIFASKDGVIHHVNPALQRLLDIEPKALAGTHVADLLLPPGKPKAPEGYGAKIVASRRLDPLRVDLKWKRQRVPVLLSGALLPPGIGGRFFVVSDVRASERLEQMQAVKKIYGSIATEMRIPLSLACSFVTEIQKEGGPGAPLAEKALAQLRRADLPLERILRLATLESSDTMAITDVNVLEVLATIKSQLPSSQAEDVRLHASTAPPAKASYSELAFCMHSIVSFLLRQKAQADALHIDVSQRQRKIAVEFWLAKDRSGKESTTDISVLDATIREFALADSLLANLMGRMGGKYEPPAEKPRFRLSLPA